jgi:Uma2 family endonuclease
LRLPEPEGFRVDRPETWPVVAGRLEYFEGALWFMPPSGDEQQETTADLVTLVNLWRQAHTDFVVGTNEAGMILGGAVRAADVAVWRKSDLGENTGGLRRAPPVLAVEVAGIDDTVDLLRDKARWYMAHGVEIVWLVLPEARKVIVIGQAAERELGAHESIPAHASLPGLKPSVRDFFRQLDERRS